MPWEVWGVPREDVTSLILAAPIIEAFGVIIIIFGALAITGGIFSIQRKKWGLALTGAICTFLIPPGIIFGVLANLRGNGEKRVCLMALRLSCQVKAWIAG